MSQSLMIGSSFEFCKYIKDILLKMAATTSHKSSSFLEMIQDENHANLVILHIPIFSLNLSTHSTNPLPVSAHAWLSKTPQIHPPTLMRTCKSGHLSHTHIQYTFHTHFYYRHSLSTPPCTMSFLIYSSYPCTIANPTTIFTSNFLPCKPIFFKSPACCHSYSPTSISPPHCQHWSSGGCWSMFLGSLSSLQCHGSGSCFPYLSHLERQMYWATSIFVALGLCCFFYILGAWQEVVSGRETAWTLKSPNKRTAVSLQFEF